MECHPMSKTDDQTNLATPLLSGYLDDKELAVELNVSPRTLARWRRLCEGPPTVNIGRKVAYRREAVLAWLASRETRR